MGKTFTDLKGKRYRVENYNSVDVDEDILTNEVTNYYVCYDGEPMVEVNDKVYYALKKYYEEHRF